MTLLLCVYENYYCTEKVFMKFLFLLYICNHITSYYSQTANQSTFKELAQVIYSCDDLKDCLGEDLVQLVKCFTDKQSAKCYQEMHGLSELDPLHVFFTKGWFKD